MLIIRVAKGGEMLGAACVQVAFNLGNAIGAYVGGLAISGGNGGVGCNELFDDGINGVWVHSENYLQS